MSRDYQLKKVGSGLDATIHGKRFHIDKDGEVARTDGNATTKQDVNTVVDTLSHAQRQSWVDTINAWAQKAGI